MDVGEGIRVKEYQIGDLADFDRPAAVKLTHELSSVARGGLKSC